eukprot:15186738-Ditylum_brightwellii.AAC.1
MSTGVKKGSEEKMYPVDTYVNDVQVMDNVMIENSNNAIKYDNKTESYEEEMENNLVVENRSLGNAVDGLLQLINNSEDSNVRYKNDNMFIKKQKELIYTPNTTEKKTQVKVENVNDDDEEKKNLKNRICGTAEKKKHQCSNVSSICIIIIRKV